MKKITTTPYLLLLLIFAISTIIFSCKPEKKMVKLTGQITDTNGEAIPSGKAIIYTWGEKAEKPDETIIDFQDGKLNTEVPEGKKYIVNIHVKGYGFVSKVFYNTLPEATYELKKATVISVNPTTAALIQDTQNNCLGSLSSRANWTTKPLTGVPVQINADGEISGFGMPGALNDSYYFHAKQTQCNGGITVNLPANSIAASKPVSVSMSVIDLFSPSGMPGDNSADYGNGPAFMESFGAFSLEIYDDEKTYNLNKEKGESATVSFPANLFPFSKEIPKRVPLLSYDERSGIWVSEGFAELDTLKKFYTAKVTHFSAVNLDIEKLNPACIRFKDQADTFDPPYRVEATVTPSGGGVPIVRNNVVDVANLCLAPVDRQFAITRLPANTYVSVAFFSNAMPLTPDALYVVKTPNADPDLVDPLRPTCTELNKCGNFTLIQQSTFANHDTLISACRDGSNIIISIATKESTFNIADYRVEIRRFNAGTPCTSEHTLSSLTLIDETVISPPTVNFKILKFSLPVSSLCNAAMNYPTHSIALEKISTGLKTSNLTNIALTCLQ